MDPTIIAAVLGIGGLELQAGYLIFGVEIQSRDDKVLTPRL